MMNSFSKSLGVAALLAVMSASPVALAGNGNQLFLVQTSPQGSLDGNTLSLDQSGASNSYVGGLVSEVSSELEDTLNAIDFDPLSANQIGEGNSATITLEGNGARLQFLQASNPLAPWAPGSAIGNNTAEVTSIGDTEGTIVQVGLSNTALLDLQGDGAEGLIAQLGSDLYSDLNVGAGGSGTVVQVGDNSSTGTVNVSPGTSVLYTQVGNNIAPVSTTGLQVISSFTTIFGTITITQEAW